MLPYQSKIKRCYFIPLALVIFQAAHASTPAKTVEEVIPITSANIRGHKALYSEGWFIVSSTEQALQYANEHAIHSSGEAISQLKSELKGDTESFTQSIQKAPGQGATVGKQVFSTGTGLSATAVVGSHKIAMSSLDFANKKTRQAWDALIYGNLSLVERTEEDRESLSRVGGNYFRDLKSDFSNVYDLTNSIGNAIETDIRGDWGASFEQAKTSFMESYEASGARSNSLSALGDIFAGYFKAIYHGLAAPSARTAVQGGTELAKVGTKVLFLPTAGAFIVASRTIEATGLTLYYTGSMGIKLISPTLESGMLSALALVSYGTIPATYAVGGTIGAVNQIAVTTATPIAAAGTTAVSAGASSIKYAAQVTYDLAAGATKVSLNQIKSGVVLGYNALTALPVQMALGIANGIVFLAWDGPRLVLAVAEGEVIWEDDDGTKQSIPVDALPVGSMVNIETLQQNEGITVRTLSDDPELIERVLEKSPQDMRVNKQ